MDETDGCGGGDNVNRPNYLDLAGNMGSTPVVSRKPKFQFTGTYEIKMFTFALLSIFPHAKLFNTFMPIKTI